MSASILAFIPRSSRAKERMHNESLETDGCAASQAGRSTAMDLNVVGPQRYRVKEISSREASAALGLSGVE